MKTFIRVFLAGIFIAASSLIPSCAPVSTQTKLQPGQYEWNPERATSGPVLMVVSIDDQMAYVYRNGIQIGRSTVSTGREGKETPTGVFTILQRKVEHESNIYKGAQMPYMQRLTWSGIAMHAGQLPGYPASGGCIRLPYEFSQKLYSVTANGTTVVITKKNTIPSSSSTPASVLLASKSKTGEKVHPDPEGRIVWNPSKSPSGPVNAVISYGDRTIYLFRNGVEIGQAPVGIHGTGSLPEGVFVKLESPGGVPSWSVLSLKGGSIRGDVAKGIKDRITIPASFRAKAGDLLAPGSILLITKESSNAGTRSGTDFDIMKPE
ncbi:L,D-transpeptidase [Persicirhabdus sediminis]|uniref:L,D-transpeptidase n=1 Tax=Persicirhabdus sediminis TaxID=454144 RepID=A0A8J7MEZ1_9BACT|nr:L,D-transpeptidase [Persicirhabdus sediminis]MBK1791742.1 L,D-transpeptidase [Persicirhabdus sediminis]